MRRRSKLCFRALYDVVPNVEMRGRALLRSVSVKLAELRRAVGLGEEWVFIGGLYDDVPNVEMRWVTL